MAISVAITTVKIDITSTGGVEVTWDECVTAINNHTPGTITGSGTSIDPYTITATTYRELEFSSGCKVRFLANTFTRWFWSDTSTTYIVLDFVDGSETVIEEGCEFDLGYTGLYTRGYVYTYGKVTAIGTLGNEIVFKNYRSFYNIYARKDQNFDYVKFTDISYISGYALYFGYGNYTTLLPTISFNHITINNENNGTYNGRLYTTGGTVPQDNIILNNFLVEHLSYSLMTYSNNIKFSNSTFKDCTNQNLYYNTGNGIGLPFNTSKVKLSNSKTFQPTTVFDNCTFDNLDNGNYCSYVFYNSRVLFKDCTFQNMDRGVYAGNGGLAFWEGTTTFTNMGINRVWGNNGTHLHVRSVGITVQDKVTGNPIQYASVMMYQVEGNEWHSGITDSNGELKNVWGYDPVLVEKEETSTNNFVQWSDSESGGQYHKIIVTASGYDTWEGNYEITSDKDLTIELEESSGDISISITDDSLSASVTDETLSVSVSEDSVSIVITEEDETSTITEESLSVTGGC